MTENNLTAKQEIAAQAFALEGMTQSDAYRKAYNTENSTDKSVHELSSKLFADIKVASRVEELRALTLKRLQVTVDRVIAEYSKLAFFDIRKAFFPDGSMKPLTELDDDTAAAIASTELTGKDGGPVELSDAKAALLRGLVSNASDTGTDQTN